MDVLKVDTFEAHNYKNLERSHYFHSQMQFIMTLVDISERLVSVPRAARQSSLIAELTLLNHNLPAQVCLPFWCPAYAEKHRHHHICGIALTDCVVLNSADRVPYLIVVEVIETSDGRLPRKFSLSSAKTTTNQSELRVPEISRQLSSNQNSADYYLKVISRRKSASESRSSAHQHSSGIMNEEEHVSSLQERPGEEKYDEISLEEDLANLKITPKQYSTRSKPSKLDNIAVLDSKEDSDPEWEDEEMSLLTVGQDAQFSDKMRTAAVLLAQLYQQQQKELALEKGNRSRSSSLSHTDKPLSPPPPNDKRSVQKRRNEFEVIRKRVLHEMSASEEERMRSLMDQKKAMGDRQVDELLGENQERELQKDDDDPSGKCMRRL
jgi:hypothetical protein